MPHTYALRQHYRRKQNQHPNMEINTNYRPTGHPQLPSRPQRQTYHNGLGIPTMQLLQTSKPYKTEMYLPTQGFGQQHRQTIPPTERLPDQIRSKKLHSTAKTSRKPHVHETSCRTRRLGSQKVLANARWLHHILN